MILSNSGTKLVLLGISVLIVVLVAIVVPVLANDNQKTPTLEPFAGVSSELEPFFGVSEELEAELKHIVLAYTRIEALVKDVEL